MSKTFFDVCVRCKKTFTDEAKFVAHMNSHTAPQMRKPIDEVEEKVRIEAQSVPGMTEADEDATLAAVKKTNAKRKKLIAAGIEAQTMTQDEAEKRYAEEKKKGTVK